MVSLSAMSALAMPSRQAFELRSALSKQLCTASKQLITSRNGSSFCKKEQSYVKYEPIDGSLVGLLLSRGSEFKNVIATFTHQLFYT